MHIRNGISLFALLPAVAAQQQVVISTGMGSYADGGIYCRIMEANGPACTSDLGNFPAKETFPLNLAYTFGSGPMSPLNVARSVDGFHSYEVKRLRLYLHNKPGAATPIGFIADNSTLPPGATTWGFFSPYGLLVWSPTGNLADAGRPNGHGSSVLVTQGFQWLPESGHRRETQGVYRLHWNNTQYEVNRKGDRTADGTTLVFYADYDPQLQYGAKRSRIYGRMD